MRVREFVSSITGNPISLIGAAMAGGSAVLIVTLTLIEAFGEEGHPYIGIITYLVLPVFLVAGLILIPWGNARHRRLASESGERPAFPIIDLNSDRTRGWLLTFGGFTAVIVVILSTATFKGVEYLDSNQFCGAVCHVLKPEYTAYQGSPHARVNCVECHIGPGASWFVKAKLSGVQELFATVFNTYPRPIPTPVHDLRPAQDTCERCHWPTKFHGTRPRVVVSHMNDSTSTPRYTILLLKVGGEEGGVSKGIHWHVDPGLQIRYRSDPSRERIYEVEMTLADGTVRRYFSSSSDDEPEDDGETVWRTMDCIDCHNRPTHIYYSPEETADLALYRNRIAADLPFIRREAVEALNVDYDSHDQARQGVAADILDFYLQNYPELAVERRQAIDEAGEVLGELWTTNVFPWMNITWNTYPNHIGHKDFSGGCFRCHSGQHATAGGEQISQSCDNCHQLLAWNEESPEALEMFVQ